jgi:serine/threonine protein kinase
MWNEKNILKRIRHPGFVKYKGFLENDKIYAILMELCSFGSLQDLLSRRVRLTEPEVRYFMVQILDSIEFLHSKWIIHRDLKLANIFLQDGFRTKIGDFGLACQLKSPNERRR